MRTLSPKVNSVKRRSGIIIIENKNHATSGLLLSVVLNLEVSQIHHVLKPDANIKNASLAR